MKDLKTKTLTLELLHKMDAYWRAANYLSVGQIYLYDNPLLKRPLKLSDVNPLVVRHWGTTPGQDFIYAHLNRAMVIGKNHVNIHRQTCHVFDEEIDGHSAFHGKGWRLKHHRHRFEKMPNCFYMDHFHYTVRIRIVPSLSRAVQRLWPNCSPVAFSAASAHGSMSLVAQSTQSLAFFARRESLSSVAKISGRSERAPSRMLGASSIP